MSTRSRAEGPAAHGRRPAQKALKADQFVVFNQQFLTLIKAGLPILKSLNILSKRQKNPYFKSILENVQDRVKSGELLSEAFEAQGSDLKDLHHHAAGGRAQRQS